MIYILEKKRGGAPVRKDASEPLNRPDGWPRNKIRQHTARGREKSRKQAKRTTLGVRPDY